MAANPYPNLPYDPCPGDLNGYQVLSEYAGRSAVWVGQAARVLALALNSQAAPSVSDLAAANSSLPAGERVAPGQQASAVLLNPLGLMLTPAFRDPAGTSVPGTLNAIRGWTGDARSGGSS